MADIIFSPAIFIYLVPAAFALTGGIMAYNRGRNPVLWGLGSLFVPFCIMIVWFEKPLKEKKGYFRKCCQCSEWIKWKEDPCRYCSASQNSSPE